MSYHSIKDRVQEHFLKIKEQHSLKEFQEIIIQFPELVLIDNLLNLVFMKGEWIIKGLLQTHFKQTTLKSTLTNESINYFLKIIIVIFLKLVLIYNFQVIFLINNYLSTKRNSVSLILFNTWILTYILFKIDSFSLFIKY